MNPDLARKTYEAYCMMMPLPSPLPPRWEQLSQNERIAWGKVAQVCHEMGYSEGCADGYDAGARGEWF